MINKSSTMIGRQGERYVGKFLKDEGYEVIVYNYLSGHNEIDIIACDKDYIVFIEVKTRSLNSKVSGLESITKAKRKRIIDCAEHFLISEKGKKYMCMQPRFDVAEIVLKNSNSFEIFSFEYIENAFAD